MNKSKICSLAILRPEFTSTSFLMENDIDPIGDASFALYAQRVDGMIADMREMFEEAGEKRNIGVSVSDCQLFGPLPDRKRRNMLNQSDIIAVVDPTPDQLSFATGCPLGHPLRRSVIVCSEKDGVDQLLGILQCQTMPVLSPAIDGERRAVVNRVFALHLPLNDDTRAVAFQHGVDVFTRAICYPHIPPHPTSYDYASWKLVLPDADA